MKYTWLFMVALLLLSIGTGAQAAEEKVLKMSTTTSTQESGLLDVLLPQFEKKTGIVVKVVAKGTGAAIRDGIDGNVDIIFVHDRPREDAFIADGYGTKRYAVMHNDFVLLGSDKDPAGVKGGKDGAAAMKKIASVKAAFISRGDDSGTHAKEQELWKASGIPVEKVKTSMDKNGTMVEVSAFAPAEGAGWYYSVGQGMGKTLTMADEKQAYTLADRGTYSKYKFGREVPIALNIVCEGGDNLANPYGLIPVNPAKHAHVKYEYAEAFAQWIMSAEGQKAIADYKLNGQQLFFPDGK